MTHERESEGPVREHQNVTLQAFVAPDEHFELIARAAQLSVGAIYLYFRSKEDLYVSLIEDALTVFDVEMGQVREHTEVGKRLHDTRVYRTCTAKRKGGQPKV